MGAFLNGVKESADKGDYTAVIDKVGEFILSLTIIGGGGFIMLNNSNNSAVLTLVSASIGAVISYYYTRQGKQS